MQITDLQMVHKELDNSYMPQYVVAVNTCIHICTQVLITSFPVAPDTIKPLKQYCSQ